MLDLSFLTNLLEMMDLMDDGTVSLSHPPSHLNIFLSSVARGVVLLLLHVYLQTPLMPVMLQLVHLPHSLVYLGLFYANLISLAEHWFS